MTHFLALALLFWVPALAILIKNVLWNLQYWVNSEFRAERLYNYYLWDHSHGNRNSTWGVLKYILFAMVSLIFTAPPVALIGIWGTYTIWIFELIEFFNRLIYKRFINFSIVNVRVLVVLLLGLVTFVLAFWTISFPFATVDRTASGGSIEGVFDINSQSTGAFYDIYIFLALSALLLIFFDLTAPIFVFLGVVLTSPFVLIKNAILVANLNSLIKKHRHNIKVVLVAGTIGKSTFAEVLKNLTESKFSAYHIEIGESVQKLFEQVSDVILDKNPLFIFEIQSNLNFATRAFIANLAPDNIVFTDLSYNKDLNIRSLVKLIEPGSNFYINKKDATYFGSDDFKIHNFFDVGTDGNISIDRVEKTKEKVRFSFKFKGIEEKFVVKSHKPELTAVLSLSVSVAFGLGIDLTNVKATLEALNLYSLSWEIDNGDNGTTIIYPRSRNSSLKQLVAIIGYGKNFLKFSRIIIFTDGFRELREKKRTGHMYLLSNLKDVEAKVITTDHSLFKTAMGLTINKVQIDLVENFDDALYKLREYYAPGDLIVLEGRNIDFLIQKLKSSE